MWEAEVFERQDHLDAEEQHHDGGQQEDGLSAKHNRITVYYSIV